MNGNRSAITWTGHVSDGIFPFARPTAGCIMQNNLVNHGSTRASRLIFGFVENGLVQSWKAAADSRGVVGR
jgi:hypothetical protein